MRRTKRTKKGLGRAAATEQIVSIDKAATSAMTVNSSKLSTPRGFAYTATSIVQARALAPRPPSQPRKEGLTPAEYAAAKAAYDAAKEDYARSMQRSGCMMPRRVRTVKSGKHAGTQVVTYAKPTGERCKGTITWDDDGNPQCSTETFRDPRCFPSVHTPGSSPCATRRFAAKGSCPIQLTWLEGKPVLRLCEDQATPGRLVRVKGPGDAMEQAVKLCKEWSRGKTWRGTSIEGGRDAGVGGVKKRRRRKAK